MEGRTLLRNWGKDSSLSIGGGSLCWIGTWLHGGELSPLQQIRRDWTSIRWCSLRLLTWWLDVLVSGNTRNFSSGLFIIKFKLYKIYFFLNKKKTLEYIDIIEEEEKTRKYMKFKYFLLLTKWKSKKMTIKR